MCGRTMKDELKGWKVRSQKKKKEKEKKEKEKKNTTAVFNKSGERCVRNNHRNVSFQRFEITRTCTKLNTDQKTGERSIGLRENRLKRLFCIYSEHLKRQSPLNEGCFILEYTLCKQRSMNV